MKARLFLLAIAISLIGCDPALSSRSSVAFASAAGAEAGKPFALLRFTPSDRGQSIAGTSVKRHPSGDLVIAGHFDGTADVGLGRGSLDGTSTAFVGRYSASGQPRWVRWMSTSDYDGPRVAVDASGDVIVLATSAWRPRPFGEPEPRSCSEPAGCAPAPALHVLSAEGELRWSRPLGAKDARERMSPSLVDVDATGDVTIAGRFGVGTDVFVARYAAQTGERRWFSRVRGAGVSNVAGLAAVRDGDVVVTGEASGELRLDDNALATQGTSAFVLRLARTDGTARWMKQLGGSYPSMSGLAVAGDAEGDVIVVARARGGEPDRALVNKLAGASGEQRWSHVIEKRAGQVRGASIDLALGTTPIVAFQLTDGASQSQAAAVVMAFSGDKGDPLWSRQLRTNPGAPSWSVEASSVASLGPSEVVVTGWFTGRADLGGLLTEAPWGREHRACRIDDDDEACRTDWAARAMFVARVGP